MIYACTTFYNRLDLIEIWLNQLKDVVDKFVIVEGNVSHTGRKRELLFKPELFEDFPITYIPITDCPEYDYVEIDRIAKHIENGILRGLTKCKDTDIIIFSDSDEILRSSQVSRVISILASKLKESPYTEMVCRLKLLQCRYWINCMLSKQEGFNSGGPVIASYRLFRELSGHRMRHFYDGRPSIRAENSGWHYSWLGPKEFIKQKLNDTVDQSYIKPEFYEDKYIEQVMGEGGDILQEARFLGKWIGTTFIEIDKNGAVNNYLFPIYVLKNKEKFKDIIWYKNRHDNR